MLDTENRKQIFKKNNELKSLPHGVNKGIIYSMWNHIPEKKIQRFVHHVQRECNPHLDPQEAINAKKVYRKEIEMIIDQYGAPPSYKEEYGI